MILETGKIYYLAHPLTTFGDVYRNYESEEDIASIINPDGEIGLIRPLECIPHVDSCDLDPEKIMEICFALLRTADGIILCPGWEHSIGCQEEAAYARHAGMDVIVYEDPYTTEFERIEADA